MVGDQNFIVCQIGFIHDQYSIEIVTTNNLPNVLQPSLNIGTRPLVVDGANQYDPFRHEEG